MNNMDRLARKFETARKQVPAPVAEISGASKTGIIAFGTSHWALTEACDQLRKEHNLPMDYLRLGHPFTGRSESSKAMIRVYVAEHNCDAQMFQLLKIDIADQVTKLRSVLHYNALLIDARSVT